MYQYQDDETKEILRALNEDDSVREYPYLDLPRSRFLGFLDTGPEPDWEEDGQDEEFEEALV